MPEVISNCEECSVCTRSLSDKQWFCNHPFFKKSGKYVNVTMLDGNPYRTGVSQHCPLRAGDLHMVLADNVTFF